MTYRQLIVISFVLNGLSMIGTKMVGELGLVASSALVIFTIYFSAAIPALAHVLAGKKRLESRSVWVGVMAGTGSVVGWSSAIRAADLLPGYIVFPLIGGATILLVVVAGRLSFREPISPFGIAGILAGVLAIVLLST